VVFRIVKAGISVNVSKYKMQNDALSLDLAMSNETEKQQVTQRAQTSANAISFIYPLF